MAKRGKKYRAALEKVDRSRTHDPQEAVKLVKECAYASFDETVELHARTNLDPRHAEQQLRGTIVLPHGLGKNQRVLVFAEGEAVRLAEEAGADYVGSDDLIKKIQGENWLDFDVALAAQAMMGQVSRLGKVLGPRGLMPTPKAGTVIPAGADVASVVREFKAGKVEYRSDKGGNVHAGVGKMSFDEDKLADNITAFVEQIKAVKPSGVKGHYVKSITIAGTMTPGVPVAM